MTPTQRPHTSGDDPFGPDPLNTAKLDAELRPYLVDHRMGLSLKHPLVFQVPFYSWTVANRMLLMKQERLEQSIRAGDFGQALWWYERPYRMFVLRDWWLEGTITLEQLRAILPSAWIDTENEEEHRAGSLELFRAAGFTTDDPEAAAALHLEDPSTELTVYHGIEHAETERGIAWTLDPKVARFFATRFRREAKVVRGRVRGSDVLAYYRNRKEEEIVLDPTTVRDEVVA